MIAHELLKRLDRGVGLARLYQRETETVTRVDRRGVEAGRSFELHCGAIEITPLLERDTKLQVRRSKARREGDGTTKLCGGCGQLALLPKHEAQIVTRLGVVRAEPNRGFKRCARPIEIARPPSRRTQVILRVEQSRLKSYRSREMLECHICLSKLTANVPETIVCGRQFWRALQRTFVRVGGAGKIVRVFFCLTELEQRLRRILRADGGWLALLRGSGETDRSGEQHPRCA
jgi:hypothetical protein